MPRDVLKPSVLPPHFPLGPPLDAALLLAPIMLFSSFQSVESLPGSRCRWEIDFLDVLHFIASLDFYAGLLS